MATIEELISELRDAETFEQCLEILDKAEELVGDEDAGDVSSLLESIRSKLNDKKSEGRDEISDAFDCSFEVLSENEETGELRIKAVVAQVDKANKNRRLYPRKEMLNAIRVAEKTLMASDALVGLVDHPGFFSGASVKDIGFVHEKLMLKGNDLHVESRTVPTTVGKEAAALLKAGVGLEWSIRGYGRMKPVYKKGKKDEDYPEVKHYRVTDYVFDTIDMVLRGAATTKTYDVSKDEAIPQPEPEGALVMGDKKNKDGVDVEDATPDDTETKPDVEDTTGTETKPDAVDTPDATPVVTVDSDAIVAQVLDKVQTELTPSVVEAASQATNAVLEAQRLASVKRERLAGIDISDEMKIPMQRALEAAGNEEEIETVFTEFKPMYESAMTQSVPSGIGIHTHHQRAKARSERWLLGDNEVERPDTIDEVFAQVLDSYEGNGRAEWDDPKNVLEASLENMLAFDERPFFYATKRGFMEAATQTSVLSPTLPSLLPMIRQLWPKLIPFEIASVQPLKTPTGRIYFLDFTTAAGADLSDSSLFDSEFADHTEAATKAQITLDLRNQDLTVTNRAIYYHVTTYLRQDMRALHGLDVDAELIRAASDEIAREINFGFLEMIRGAQTGGTVLYGTDAPGSVYSGQDWNNRLGAHIGKARSLVAQKVYQRPDWIVGGPTAIEVMMGMNTGGIVAGDVVKYGTGLSKIGIQGGTTTVYEAEWFHATTLLMGYKPPEWKHTGAVYAPYVPLYVSPEEFTASDNTAKRSVSTRSAMDVVRSDAYSEVVVDVGATGVEPW